MDGWSLSSSLGLDHLCSDVNVKIAAMYSQEENEEDYEF